MKLHKKKNEGFFSNLYGNVTSFFKNTFGAGYTVIKEDDYGKDIISYLSLIKVSYVDKTTEVIRRKGDSSKPISVYCTYNSEKKLKSSAGIKINVFGTSLNVSVGLENIGITGSYTNDNNTTYFGCGASLSDLNIGCNVGVINSEDDVSKTTGVSASVNGPLLFGILFGFPKGTTTGPSLEPA